MDKQDADDPCAASFSFLCSKTWAELTPTCAEEIRYCDNCKRDVFRITSRAQLEEARSLGRCVAWARPATSRSRGGPSLLLGDPVMASWPPKGCP